jgi:lipopolysaccharide export system permease protein
MKLFDVIIFTLGNEDKFLRRVDARAAQLRDGYWLLEDALVTAPESTAMRYPRVTLPTKLTVNQIQESFAPPETLSFWQLPAFIRTMEASGFAAQRHRLYWYSLMAMPLLLCAMVLVGAVFALKYRRVGNTGMLIISGAAAGFGVYFLSDLIGALALSGSLPPALAAWSIAAVATVVGVITLLHQEDG